MANHTILWPTFDKPFPDNEKMKFSFKEPKPNRS